MTNPGVYDPVKAHDYYEKHKHLKGRHPATKAIVDRVGDHSVRPSGVKSKVTAVQSRTSAHARVIRLTTKIKALHDALAEAETALRNKKQKDRENSDGKTTVKQRQDAKKYRDTHKAKIAADQKKQSGAGGGDTSPKTVSNMSESELEHRITRIKGLISTAKNQLQDANAQANFLSHSEFISHSGPSAVNTNQEGDCQNGRC